MLKTNKDKLPLVSVQGVVWQSTGTGTPIITVDGEVKWLTRTGGITFNAQIGDICLGWAADHLEPGVSTRHKDDGHNGTYQVLSCIGNEAIVRNGDAKGDKGIVTGKHGGAEHLMVYFAPETLEKLNIDDQIMVRAQGQGMELLDYPDITLRNMSPALLEKMSIKEKKNKLKIGVAKILPADIMGSGLGAVGTARGDYDITMFSPDMVEKYDLADLRFGDIIAITNADTAYGRSYRTGACTIGVIIHGDSFIAGHGPGVTTLMSTKLPVIEPIIDKKANLKDFFV